MIRIAILAVVTALFAQVSAQDAFVLDVSKPVYVYSLPKTELVIEVETEKVTRKPGMFFQYSERYLGTKNVILEESTTYRLKNLRLTTQAVPDEKRTFSITSDKFLRSKKLVVNEKGILCGVNIDAPAMSAEEPVLSLPIERSLSAERILPLGEEYMMAGSMAKLAEGAAKQIYRIREGRMALLTGDLESLPGGTSVQAMLDGQNKAEKELLELFVGSEAVETQVQKIFITPDVPLNNYVLFRISSLRGLVSADDLSGVPYYINVEPAFAEKLGVIDFSKSERLNTVLPASTQITVSDGVNTYLSHKCFMPQFGEIVQLSEKITTSADTKILVDSQTGRLLMVSK